MSIEEREKFENQQRLQADINFEKNIEAAVIDSKRNVLPSKIDDRIRLIEGQIRQQERQGRKFSAGFHQA
jgi:hypothetical protein